MVANFNHTYKDKASLADYDYSWLPAGYKISVKHNVPDGTDQRASSSVSAVIVKNRLEMGSEYDVRVVDENDRMVTGPQELTDERIIRAFDKLKVRFEKVVKAEKYLGEYPKVSTGMTPRPPAMRNSVGTMRP